MNSDSFCSNKLTVNCIHYLDLDVHEQSALCNNVFLEILSEKSVSKLSLLMALVCSRMLMGFVNACSCGLM